LATRSERERHHFDQLATDLGTVWWGSVTPAGRLRLDERAELAVRRAKLAPGVTVLEPGAGNGAFTQKIATSGATIIGVEISPLQCQLAATELAGFANAKVVVGNIEERLDFPDASFDSIVGNSVLHHLDLARALPEMLRLLKVGGRMFFTEPNMLNPQIALERNVKVIGRRLMNSPDETAFVRWRLSRILRDHGMVNVNIRPFDFVHPGTPVRVLPAMMRMSHLMNRVPLVREIAGSLQIYAER
jgi:SAM-dependent methyltransferase